MSDNREFYRKKVSSPGYILRPGGDIQFQIRDVSVDGFQGHFDHAPPFAKGDMLRIRLPSLHMECNATVVRVSQDENPGYTVGYKVGFLFGERNEWNPNAVFAPPAARDQSPEDSL